MKEKSSKYRALNVNSNKTEGLATVLLVDDQQFNLFAMQSMFESLGVSAEICLSGDLAIEMLAQRFENDQPLYKLIFLDYSMPMKDGPQTASEIRSFCEEKCV